MAKKTQNSTNLVFYETDRNVIPSHINEVTCIKAGMAEKHLVRTCQYHGITLGEIIDLIMVRQSRNTSIAYLVKIRAELIRRGDVRIAHIPTPQLIDEFYSVQEELFTSGDNISIKRMLKCFWRFDEMPLDAADLSDRIRRIHDTVGEQYVGSSIKWFLYREKELQARCGVATFEAVIDSFKGQQKDYGYETFEEANRSYKEI